MLWERGLPQTFGRLKDRAVLFSSQRRRLQRVLTMASYQTPESKKQEFRKYLEKSGVIDALTKGMYCAHAELPENRPSCRVYGTGG
jgi:hypothetical protein